MEEKIIGIIERYDIVVHNLNDPSIISNNDLYRQFSKELTQLEPIVVLGKKYISLQSSLLDNQTLINETHDSELKTLAYQEKDELTDSLLICEEELRFLLLPKDPNDKKNCITDYKLKLLDLNPDKEFKLPNDSTKTYFQTILSVPSQIFHKIIKDMANE